MPRKPLSTDERKEVAAMIRSQDRRTRLKGLRLRQGIKTNVDLATKAGVHRNSINRYERGDSLMDITLIKLCRILHCSAEQLVGRDIP